jgi:hypothetical protein
MSAGSAGTAKGSAGTVEVVLVVDVGVALAGAVDDVSVVGAASSAPPPSLHAPSRRSPTAARHQRSRTT